MARRLAFAVLVLAAGCGKAGPPDRSRLEPGARAMLLDFGDGKAPDGRLMTTTSLGQRFVPVGLEVRVVRDDEPGESRHRDVVVIVPSGEHEGAGGVVARYRLAPLK
jgi:hypothetical protein